MTRQSSLTVDQRAFVVGEEGICPECEEKVAWSDIDKNWYMCETCVNAIVNGVVDVRDGVGRENNPVEASG